MTFANRQIHATGRAIERLRWPAEYAPVYQSPVGRTACGFDLRHLAPGTEKFTAEFAFALMNGFKTTFEWTHTDRDGPRNSSGWERIVGVPLEMPTCAKCAVAVDAAMASPMVIHANEALYPGVYLPTHLCGERIDPGVQVFGMQDLTQARALFEAGRLPRWLPTCETCLEKLDKGALFTFSRQMLKQKHAKLVEQLQEMLVRFDPMFP